eukprot:Nk52_evm74s62 gene=Nk52_evmTU74s62
MQASVKAIARGNLRFRPTKQAMTITESAATHIKNLLKEKNDPSVVGFKVGVVKRGCNGLTYNLDYAKEDSAKKLDEVVEQHGVKVIIDSKALFSLINSSMDFEDSKLSSGFVFYNPNVKGACGCGESFSV